MNWQTLLLEPAVLAAIARAGASSVASQRSTTSRALVALAVGFASMAVLFLVAGGYIWLDELYGSRHAALLMGSAALLLSFLTLGVSVYVSRKRRAIIAAHHGEITRHVEGALQALMAEIEEPVKAYPKSALAIAALVGYVAAGTLREGTDALLRPLEQLSSRHLHH